MAQLAGELGLVWLTNAHARCAMAWCSWPAAPAGTAATAAAPGTAGSASLARCHARPSAPSSSPNIHACASWATCIDRQRLCLLCCCLCSLHGPMCTLWQILDWPAYRGIFSNLSNNEVRHGITLTNSTPLLLQNACCHQYRLRSRLFAEQRQPCSSPCKSGSWARGGGQQPPAPDLGRSAFVARFAWKHCPNEARGDWHSIYTILHASPWPAWVSRMGWDALERITRGPSGTVGGSTGHKALRPAIGKAGSTIH